MRLMQRVALLAAGIAATLAVIALPAGPSATAVHRADGGTVQPDNWNNI